MTYSLAFFDAASRSSYRCLHIGTKALKQKQTEDMESDLLAYLESVPPPANDSSVNNAEAESAAQAPVTTVTHELIEAVVSELIADGQDVQYLHVRNALRKRLNRLLTASEKDILSTCVDKDFCQLVCVRDANLNLSVQQFNFCAQVHSSIAGLLRTEACS